MNGPIGEYGAVGARLTSSLEPCKRYDRKKKEVIEVPRPAVVAEYNSYAGGTSPEHRNYLIHGCGQAT